MDFHACSEAGEDILAPGQREINRGGNVGKKSLGVIYWLYSGIKRGVDGESIWGLPVSIRIVA